MANVKHVQLHEIIKNSLATYLSYKWSANKLYLKKRNKKPNNDESNKKCGSKSLEKQHSIINLENDVFVYDAKTKTFTQLDLCDCFKNGFKYRKVDPFKTASTRSKRRKKYELCEISNKSSGSTQQFQTYQLVKVGNSEDNIFHNRAMESTEWGNNLKNMPCPSKFDLFIQNELNKCAGKSFNVKSFKMNAEQESAGSTKNNKVCSSAAIGYYTITSFENGLQGEKLEHSRAVQDDDIIGKNYKSINEEISAPKKMYSKGLQCKRSNPLSNSSPNKKEKMHLTSETGIQCYFKQDEETTRIEPLDTRINDILSKKRQNIIPRQKLHSAKREIGQKHSSLSAIVTFADNKKDKNLIEMDSSAEIRRILNESQSTSSLNENYRKKYLKQRPIFTYYHTSTTSKDDTPYMRTKPIVVAATSAPISPNCSIESNCREQFEKKQAAIKTCPCVRRRDPVGERILQEQEPSYISSHVPSLVPTKVSEYVPSHVPVPSIAPEDVGCNLYCPNACNQRVVPTKCPSECPCPCQENVESGQPMGMCICQPVPAGACCDCVVLDTTCICDVLCNLKERIKRQIEEQNRNLDQILDELNKQDKELKEIRKFVDKSRRHQVKGKCCGSRKTCTCYRAEVEHHFTTDMKPLPGKEMIREESDGSEDTDKTEMEIVELYGSDTKQNIKKDEKRLKRDSWRNIWCRNNDFKAYYVNGTTKQIDRLPERIISSSNSHTDDQLKKRKKWFSNIFTSKRDLKKSSS